MSHPRSSRKLWSATNTNACSVGTQPIRLPFDPIRTCLIRQTVVHFGHPKCRFNVFPVSSESEVNVTTIKRKKPFKKGEKLWGKVIEALVLPNENDLSSGTVIHSITHDCLITVTETTEDEDGNQSASFFVERMEKPQGES